ncbi:AbrB/MazE/SpoVT family DNA-binding domain-containing protein [Sphingopyxis sp.]|uniref:AbrB/MazE/SpoVT family DNA-binding domain-containing protein n=1 Tax=Sphingopyxis sp. TaxID=1908224 RepID=UPI001DDC47A8|nr:AbrB/MazE/SpoVT family DNA-binding domain-containing protein [Sphingopyxis sp.]MBW8295677.1 AbrB/MazE/SpoVT family DNA-binding domain-containing protein [Sphingopyxis sp.]
MNTPLKITKVGNSAAVILSKELIARLGAAQGDMLSVRNIERGNELAPYDADFETQMAAAREVMARRKRAWREPAK